MKIKTIIKGFLLTAAAAVAICCQKEEGETTKQDITQDLEFTKLEVEACGYNSAEISVRHSGTTTDTWYGFVTTDTKKKDILLIAEIINNGKPTKLNKGVSKRVKLTDLNPATKYKYIVFAITEDGQLYGTAKSVTFETIESIMEEVNTWSISYKGRNAKNEETFAIENTDASPIYTTFVSKRLIGQLEDSEEFQEYGGLRLLDENDNVIVLLNAEEAIVYMEMMSVFGFINDGYDVSDITSPESFEGDRPRMQSGDYLAICIECDDKGPTGYYSCDEITIEAETASEDYNKWIGKWTFTAANNVTYTMKLSEEDPNFIYAAQGWECDPALGNENDFSTYGDNLLVPMFYDKLTRKFYIKSYDWGPATTGSETNWGLFGWYTPEDGETTDPIPFIADEKICEASYSDNEAIQLTACKVGGDFDKEYMYTGMRYTTYTEREDGIGYGFWNNLATFPITMTKVNGSPVTGTDDNTGSETIKTFNVSGGIKAGVEPQFKKLGFPMHLIK